MAGLPKKTVNLAPIARSFDTICTSVCIRRDSSTDCMRCRLEPPILFTMYIDKLLVILRTSGMVCHIGSVYMGSLPYADDITLLCPSIRGLNEMSVLCCEYDITFNPEKPVCIKFGIKINIYEHVSINGFPVQCS